MIGQNKAVQFIRIATLTLLGILFVFPFYWMFTSSVKPLDEIFLYPPKLLPSSISFTSYSEAWSMQDFNQYLLNTLRIMAFNIVWCIGMSAVVAYGFARFKFRGRNMLFAIVLATMIIPDEILFIPRYVLFNRFGWLNTHAPLIVPRAFGDPFFIFLVRQYLMGLPRELDEAATIDGCGRVRVFMNILLPLLLPVLTTCVIFQFMNTWNDYMGPLLYLQTRDTWTMSLGLASLNSEQVYSSVNWGHRMAISSIYAIVPSSCSCWRKKADWRNRCHWDQILTIVIGEP